jgi:hypothetical protein
MRRFIGTVLCSVAPAWVALSILQERLLEAGVLNKKDMPPFVGNETGTVSEYLLNVWHWDGMLLLMMIAALPCLVSGMLLLWGGRVHAEHENAA